MERPFDLLKQSEMESSEMPSRRERMFLVRTTNFLGGFIALPLFAHRIRP
jgi:hypothetical protein